MDKVQSALGVIMDYCNAHGCDECGLRMFCRDSFRELPSCWEPPLDGGDE